MHVVLFLYYAHVCVSLGLLRPEKKKAVIQGALAADRALRDNDEGAWAALLCLEGLVSFIQNLHADFIVTGWRPCHVAACQVNRAICTRVLPDLSLAVAVDAGHPFYPSTISLLMYRNMFGPDLFMFEAAQVQQ